MKRLPVILKKEFTQIFRNKAMLPIIFVIPIVQLLILVNAANFEIKNLRMVVSDFDNSQASMKLVESFVQSPYFNVVQGDLNFESDMDQLDKGKADVILRIKKGFSEGLLTGEAATMFDFDGIDGQKASVGFNYAQQIVQRFIREQMRERGVVQDLLPLKTTNRYWYNAELDYKNLMVPGLLAVLVSMVGMFLSSMNIVIEKEIGTIEQLNVTPITKFEFIAGKLLPFWFICLFELSFGLLIGWLIFQIPILGSLILLFSFAGIYFFVMLGFGLLISTFTDTQQQAMFISWFFMVIFILMGGLFTPIENMPDWAQKITWFNPAAYFIDVLRLVLLKGSGFNEISRHFIIMTIMALFINGFAIAKYQKRVN